MKKRSIVLFSHPTSVSLEPEFWDALQDLAAQEKKSLSALIANIDKDRTTNLSSALRLYVLNMLKKRIADMRPAPTDKA